MTKDSFFTLMEFVRAHTSALALIALLIGLAFCVQARPADERSLAIENTAIEESRHWNRASIGKSVELYGQAAAAWESMGDLTRAALCFRNAAEQELLIENFQAAERFAKRARDLSIRSGDRSGEVHAVSLLVLISLKLANVKAAEELTKEGLALSSDLNDPAARAAALSAAAEFSYSEYNLRKSVELALEARGLWLASGVTKKEIVTLTQLGYGYAGLDDPQTALTYGDLALAKSLEIGDVRQEAIARFQLGFIYLLLNEPQKALETCRRAEVLFPDDVDVIEKARLSNGIASIYGIYGDWESSLVYTKRAIELFRSVNYAKGELAASASIIELYLINRDEAAALAHFDRVKKLSDLLKDDFYIATALQFIAKYHYDAGNDAKSIVSGEKSLQLMKKARYQQGSLEVQNLVSRALIRSGKHAQAAKLIADSLTISRDTKNSLGEADALFMRSMLEAAKGQSDAALATIEESIAVTDYLAANISNIQILQEFFASYDERYEIYVQRLADRGLTEEEFVRKAFQANDRARSRAMRQSLFFSNSDIISDANPETAKKENELVRLLNSKSDRLTALLANDPETDVSAMTGEISELKNQINEVRAKMRESSPVYSSIRDPKPFDIAEFQREAMDDGSIFLEYSLGRDRSFLWVVERERVSQYTLPSKAEIEGDARELIEILMAREMHPADTIESYNQRVASAESRYGAVATRLSNVLLGPAADRLAGKKIIVSPQGELSFLPFASLPQPGRGVDEPLIMSNEVVYAPSASILGILKTMEQGRRTKPSRDLLVYSDPVFSVSDERLGKSPEPEAAYLTSAPMLRSADAIKNLGRLPASEREAAAVSAMVFDSTIESGFSASRANVLKTGLSDYRIIHFATHGVLNREHPDLSGILLSLFDENGAPNDGFIRAQDIFGFELNADLVVLSACNSGVGKQLKGEGVMSLNSAFLQAGARSVVSSLWKVDDKATEQLMEAFYEAMAHGGKTPAQALRQAQMAMMHDRRYGAPFYWAAFTVTGNADRPVVFLENPWPRRSLIVLAVLLGIGATLLAIRYRRRPTPP